MFFVGVFTAFVACGIDISVEETAKLKFGLLRQITDDAVRGNVNTRLVPDIRSFLYPVSGRISGFICRISGWPDNRISGRISG